LALLISEIGMRYKICFIFLFFGLGMRAQFVLSNEVNLAQELIMQLRFVEAKEAIDAAEQSLPTNGFIPYLKSNLIFLTVFVSDNQQEYLPAVDSIKKYIAQVRSNNADTSAFYRYCLAEMHFELGAIHMQFGYNFKSAWVMMDAFKFIKENSGVSLCLHIFGE
jgi:hypothetical protein